MPIKDDAARREYFRDYMRRKRAGQNKPGPKKADDRQVEIDAFRQRVSELEAELASERAKQAARNSAEHWAALKREHDAAEKAKREAKQAAKREAAQQAMASMLPEQKATLLEKLEHAERQLKARNTEIRNLKASIERWRQASRATMMPKRLHRQVLGFLHPDRAHGDEAMRKRLERCFQEFNAIKFAFPPSEDA